MARIAVTAKSLGWWLVVSGMICAGVVRAGDDIPVEIEADNLEHLTESNTVNASGNIKITKGKELELQADQCSYNTVERSMDASGNVRLRREGDLFFGDRAQVNMTTQQGRVENATADLAGPGGRVTAAEAIQNSKDSFSFSNATFTNCDCEPAPWYLAARRIEVDLVDNQAVARDVRLYLGGVPIAYSPWWSHPVKKVRQSGFLAPSLRVSGSAGMELDLPYYWNYAQEQDFTFTLHPTTERGTMGKVQYRYLGPTYDGTFETHAIYDTQEEAYRGLTVFDHRQELDEWRFLVHLEGTKTRDYLNDFSQELVDDSSRYLESSLRVDRAWERREGFSVLEGGVRWFQDLEAVDDETTVQQLPYLWLSDNRPLPVGVAGLRVVTDLRADNFYQLDGDNTRRVDLAPSLRYDRPLHIGHFSLKAGVEETSYSTSGNTWQEGEDGDGTSSREAFRMVARLDTQLRRYYPEGVLGLGGGGVLHTFEPTLQYVANSVSNQEAIPDYDSDFKELFTGTLFTDNHYSGIDRISQGQWIAYGVTSRLIGGMGAGDPLRELATFTVGQRWAPPGDRDYQSGYSTSDIVAGVKLYPGPNLEVELDSRLDQHEGRVGAVQSGVGYTTQRKDRFELSYYYDRSGFEDDPDDAIDDDISEVVIRSAVLLVSNWRWKQEVDYSLVGDGLQGWETGLVYEHECWSFELNGGWEAVTDTDEHGGGWIGMWLSFKGLGDYGIKP